MWLTQALYLPDRSIDIFARGVYVVSTLARSRRVLFHVCYLGWFNPILARQDGRPKKLSHHRAVVKIDTKGKCIVLLFHIGAS